MTLNNYDTLLFPCDPAKPCLMPHYFHVLYPNDLETEAYMKTSYSVFEKRNRLTAFNKSHKRANWAKYLNEGVGQEKAMNLGEWTSNERDVFKRFILIYGYSRWQTIRESAKQVGYNLDDKTDEEMNLYANGFFTSVIEQMHGQENKEIK